MSKNINNEYTVTTTERDTSNIGRYIALENSKDKTKYYYEVQQSNYKVLWFIRQSRLYPNIQKAYIF